MSLLINLDSAEHCLSIGGSVELMREGDDSPVENSETISRR
jgi:hypothetical protein